MRTGSTRRPPRTCSAKADTLFKGETLRSILLNAYGWWTVATIALYAGIFMVLAGIAMAFLSFLGFRHAGRREEPVTITVPETETARPVGVNA